MRRCDSLNPHITKEVWEGDSSVKTLLEEVIPRHYWRSNNCKTLFTRMGNIKLGKMFEDDATNINDVEKALSLVEIKLRDTENSFRPLGDVLDDVAAKWGSMTEVQKNAVAGAIAGTRQAEIFRTLMANYDQVREAQDSQLESAGLATNRYQIYMEGLEAATNKFSTAWEKMWMNSFPPSIIKWFIDLGTGVLEVVDAVGLLQITLTALLTVFAARGWGTGLYAVALDIVPVLTQSIGVITQTTIATKSLSAGLEAVGLSAKAASAVMTGLWLGALFGGIALLKELNVTAQETYTKFKEMESMTANNVSELGSLALEYEKLATKTGRNSEETARLLDIQSILNTKYGASTEGVRLYTDAISGNTDAIKENVEWIEKQKEKEQEDFLAKNKFAYEDAKKRMGEGQTILTGRFVAFNTSYDKEIEYLAKYIEANKEAGGYGLELAKESYATLTKEREALQNLIIEYEHYKNLLEAGGVEPVITFESINNMLNASNSADLLAESIGELQEALKSQTQAMMDANDQMLSLVASYDEYGELTMEQVEQLKNTYPDEYFKALTIEGDKFRLNKDELKKLVLAKVDAAIYTAEMALALDKENVALQNNLKVLQAYKSQILNGTALNTDAIQKQKQAQEELLKDTISMIKDRVNREKDALQEELRAFKDTIDEKKQALEDYADQQKQNLQDELDRYKLIIDNEKRLIEQKDKARDHANAVSDKNKEIADIDNELLALQFDNSEEAKARRLELEAQKVEKMRELDDIQNDYSVENQKQALDDEYDQFERANKLKQDQIDATLKIQLRALETEYKAYEDNINAKIKALEDYLNNTGAITQDAMKLLKDKTKEFFDELSAWSIKAGNKADELTRKWMLAFGALMNYVQMAMIAANTADGGGITGSGAWDDDDRDFWNEFYPDKYETKHSGGFIGGRPMLKSDEQFAKVLKGEHFDTQYDMSNFMNNVLPKTMAMASPSEGRVGDINITIPVQGNLDKSVIPDLKSVIFETINNVLKERGIRRPAMAYSI